MDRYQELAELQRKWTPPAELTGSAPREVRLSGGGVGLAILAVVLFVAGIAGGFALQGTAARELVEQKLLREQGADVESQVLRHWRTRDKESRTMVSYTLEMEGRTYSKSVKVPRRIWQTLDVGSQITVRFLPSNPAINRPRDWETQPAVPVWLPIIVGLTGGAVGALLVVILKRQLQLLSEGRPAPAIVTRYSFAQHGSKNVHYEFPLLGGGVQRGKRGPTRSLPAIGSTLCVLYDRDNPRRNAPYPLDMARLANPVRGGKIG